MRHKNIGQFYGLLLLEVSSHIVWEGGRETLQSLFQNEAIINDGTIQLFLIFNIIAGLHYIHKRTPLLVHGSLSSQTIIIDSRFVAKINDIGSAVLSRAITKRDSVIMHLIRRRSSHRDQAAPSGSQESDIFALGVVICEIMLGHTVKPNNLLPLQIDTIQYRDPIFQLKIRHVLQWCCSVDTDSRPSIAEVVNELEPYQPTGNVVESLLNRLQKHADRLEDIVRIRTAELLSESKKVDDLLAEIIPASLVPALRNKLQIHAETFESVTIYFSSMVGFDQFCRTTSPMEVGRFLNHLYTSVDKHLYDLDVYKVETIKDGYVVASGAPVRNDRHAHEIATLALRVMEKYSTCNSPTHLPIRIGIHTGPIAAGIVGVRMPRYCLFGDTMNTASRMESHGEGSKIHISLETKQALARKPEHIFQPRGIIDVKSKVNFLIVILGESPLYGYFALMPYFDASFAICKKRFPETFANVTMQAVFEPNLPACGDTTAAMPAITGKIYQILERFSGLTILFTPGCNLEVVPLADLAREKDVPVISSTIWDPTFANRQRFPTFLSFSSRGTGGHVPATRAMMRRYGWRTVTIFCDTLSKNAAVATFISSHCQHFPKYLTVADGFQVYFERYDSTFDDDYRPRLLRARSQSRIIILLTRADEVRKIMVLWV
ncbi:atrial natriuretic peptide receptor 2-like [Paramacrobiotus metropolitanus]|uniref:atrial natriuretic peptide receptor 2-like n=1 Tax=Paramacrobiotus metropolitanus TaxID=2943436 RepID=UPI00244617D9|nr:atrial natriuretic peptide receptor 2-like [Paramacrobiotus metropolitanus]